MVTRFSGTGWTGGEHVGDDNGNARKLQWTVKGIDPEVRELSRKAARKSGMRMGSWVETALRGAALNELEGHGPPQTQLRADVFEKISKIEDVICERADQNSRMMLEIQRDLHVLHRGLLERMLRQKA